MLVFLSFLVFALGAISLLLGIFKENKRIKNPSLKSGSILILLYLSLAALIIVFTINLVDSGTTSEKIDSLNTLTNKLEIERDSLKNELKSTKSNFISSDNNISQFNNTKTPSSLKIRLRQLLDKINLEIIPLLKNDNAACVFINQTNLKELLEMKDSLAIQNILKITPTGNTLLNNKQHSNNCINDVTDGSLTGYLLIGLKNFQ